MTKIFVGSLPYSTTSDELSQLFQSFGTISSATVISDKFTGQSRGFGFVEMENDDEAQKAIKELDGYSLNGRNLAVSVAKPREEKSDRGGFQHRGGYERRGGFNDRRGDRR
ncbi:RNA-binding protein [Patescibacteria group bacterium]|nr:RNA-binding protein [Patescibacteria group bacterium]MCL5409592.1 RNA-binding protein [Patescibacteria group bacterium]